MKIIFTFLLFFGTIGFVFSQDVDNKIETKKQELSKNKVDTFITYFVNCIGWRQYRNMNDSCNFMVTKYLFWVKNGFFYKQKFTNCETYIEEKLETSNFLKVVLNNIDSIKNDEILPVENYERDSLGVIDRNNLVISSIIDHSCITKFVFTINKTTFSKRINQFDLDQKMVNEQCINDNYELNQKSILKTIKDLVELEKQNK
jgi:hypothetical protein